MLQSLYSLDRDIAALVARHLALVWLERSVMPGSPRLVGSLYAGVARPNPARSPERAAEMV